MTMPTTNIAISSDNDACCAIKLIGIRIHTSDVAASILHTLFLLSQVTCQGGAGRLVGVDQVAASSSATNSSPG